MTPSSHPLLRARRLARHTAALGLSAALAGGLGLLPAAAPAVVATPAPALAPVAHSGSMPLLKQGSSGAAVVDLQRHLGIPADGAFGPQTRAAVVSFQSSHGLASDGVVGSRTWSALGGTAAPAAVVSPRPATAATTGYPTLKQGSRGSAVADLQRRLGIGADGVFGAQTRAAVVRFQSSRGLGADGVVGPNTWGALLRGTTTTASRGTPRTAPPATTASLGSRAIAEARSHVGKPYVYGAAGPNSFDCSGFTQYVFSRLGISLPHSSAAQYAALPHVPASQVRQGDLVFARTNGRITHVGVYDADGYWYVARHTGTTITRQKIYTTDVLVGRPA